LGEIATLFVLSPPRHPAEELDEAFQLLQKAEVLSASNSVAAAVTFNNLACYYRRCFYLMLV
jgi:hypothetical protein